MGVLNKVHRRVGSDTRSVLCDSHSFSSFHCLLIRAIVFVLPSSFLMFHATASCALAPTQNFRCFMEIFVLVLPHSASRTQHYVPGDRWFWVFLSPEKVLVPGYCVLERFVDID